MIQMAITETLRYPTKFSITTTVATEERSVQTPRRCSIDHNTPLLHHTRTRPFPVNRPNRPRKNSWNHSPHNFVVESYMITHRCGCSRRRPISTLSVLQRSIRESRKPYYIQSASSCFYDRVLCLLLTKSCPRLPPWRLRPSAHTML